MTGRWNCDFYQDRFPDFMNQRLAPEEHDAIETHLLHCTHCKQELEGVKSLARALRQTSVAPLTLEASQRGWQQLEHRLAKAELDPALALFLYEPQQPSHTLSLRGCGALLRMQFHLLRQNFYLWILPTISFFVVLFLSLVLREFSLRYPQTIVFITNGLAFLSPLLGAFCIAFLFSPEEAGLFSIGRTTNTPLALLLLLRFLVGFGYSLLVTVLGTLVFLSFVPGLSLSWIVVELLLPLSFLASLCLLAAALANSWVAVCCSSICWFLRVAGYMSQNSWLAAGYESFWHRPGALLICASLMCLSALLAFQWRGERLLLSASRLEL